MKITISNILSLFTWVDRTRFMEVQRKLREEKVNAVLWKDACLLYFQQFSHMPIPYDIERPVITWMI